MLEAKGLLAKNRNNLSQNMKDAILEALSKDVHSSLAEARQLWAKKKTFDEGAERASARMDVDPGRPHQGGLRQADHDHEAQGSGTCYSPVWCCHDVEAVLRLPKYNLPVWCRCQGMFPVRLLGLLYWSSSNHFSPRRKVKRVQQARQHMSKNGGSLAINDEVPTLRRERQLAELTLGG